MKYSCERVFRACSRTTEQCFVYLVYLLIELIIVVTPNVIELIIAAIPMSLLSSAFQNSSQDEADKL